MTTVTEKSGFTWVDAYNGAIDMMNEYEGLEPTSAFKQSAFDEGIPERQLSSFLTWAYKMFGDWVAGKDEEEEHSYS